MEQTPVFENDTGRLTGDLDRLEVKVGKIGLNTSEVARSILLDMDEAYTRIQAMEGDSSRKQASAQFEGISGKLRREAGAFLRDLGGVSALQKARSSVNPPADHWWWFLDGYLAEKRRASMKRTLITLGIIAVGLVVLGLLYNQFLAPDPAFVARYGHEQSARDALMNDNLDIAMLEIEQGLAISPNDPTMLMLRGVVKEKQGSEAAAQQDYAASETAYGSREIFLVARGQAYALAALPEKALADGRAALQINPNLAEAYLLVGGIYEATRNYREAVTAYDQAFDAASKSDQNELAAMAKMRSAMAMQAMNAQMSPAPTLEMPAP